MKMKKKKKDRLWNQKKINAQLLLLWLPLLLLLLFLNMVVLLRRHGFQIKVVLN